VKANLKRIIIAAVSQNGIIGKNNSIPWHSKSELLHFKKTTLGFPIIIGRKTFESIGTDLKGRLNLVITKNQSKIKSSNKVLFFPSVGSAYQFLRKNEYNKVFICGGKSIYTNTIKHAEEMIISKMNISVSRDTSFPIINKEIWKEVKEEQKDEFVVKFYQRNK